MHVFCQPFSPICIIKRPISIPYYIAFFLCKFMTTFSAFFPWQHGLIGRFFFSLFTFCSLLNTGFFTAALRLLFLPTPLTWIISLLAVFTVPFIVLSWNIFTVVATSRITSIMSSSSILGHCVVIGTNIPLVFSGIW